MMTAIRDYFAALVESFGHGWNRFWFTPSDPAALSLLRICTGLIALYVVLSYTPDLDVLFGPAGLVSPESLESLQAETSDVLRRQFVSHQARDAMPREFAFSYLNHVHSSSMLYAAHWAGVAVLALYTAGLFTRVTSVLALVVALSYIHRGPLLTGHVEPILAFLMFYLCLGPAGAEWSLDRFLRLRASAAQPVQISTVSRGALAGDHGEGQLSAAATISLRLIQIHVTLLYALMAIGKLSSEVWWDGLAVWWLIAKPESRLVDLTWLHAAPMVVYAWTNFIMIFQAAFPILVWNRLARPLMLGLSIIVWASLAPITGLLTFSLLMMVLNLAFVPPQVVRSWLPNCCSLPANSSAAAV
jgi:hypothetical protein